MHTPNPNIAPLPVDSTAIRLGDTPYLPTAPEVTGEHVTIEGEPYICLHNVDALKPFFMSIVSNGDLWIFAGSNSPFTAGRSHPDNALFPYQTADKIMEHPDSAGAMSIFLVRRDDREWALWEPWRPSGRVYRITRNLYKHAHGSAVIFEEINHTLGVRFRWSLTASDEFGLVRECELANLQPSAVSVKYLDGWHRLLPAGVGQDLYARFSYLAAAYMRHERKADSTLGIYTLNSRISDRAEPAESLRTSCAWSLGHVEPTVLLSTRQVEAFRRNAALMPETEVRGEFGAYLVSSEVELTGMQSHHWVTVADTGLDHAALVALQHRHANLGNLGATLQASVADNRRGLRNRIAAADGLQQTGEQATSVHHFANVLFNCMRGGTFTDSYSFPSADFGKFLKSRNTTVHARHKTWLEQLPEQLSLENLGELAAQQKDAHLDRLAKEYLPLTFSRRHGDPSRPWNRFAIRVKNEQGETAYDYQGNWRDIFQNWESLAYSYPATLERMIAVFLNASTADGYNPYRVTRGGIDWEVPDHDDPWSHIGYWGDHQLIYLLRLLQAREKHYPGRLAEQLGERLYAYAVVPYEIRGYDDIVKAPGDSIQFNTARHQALIKQAETLGNDGKLMSDAQGEIALIPLAEKILAPLLAKLSNLVPEGGIWMNTQRPDWNDANNALVGWGLSMVTVYQMRQYIRFADDLFAASPAKSHDLSAPVVEFIADITSIFGRFSSLTSVDDIQRRSIVEALGRAGEKHRRAVYAGELHTRTAISNEAIRELLAQALKVTDATIRSNRRDDGMYHSYNLLLLHGHSASIKRLHLMLEGQVNALSCKVLSAEESIALLQAMNQSDLYRADQQSFMLYPDKKIASFLDRNTLPKDWLKRAPLLLDFAASGHTEIVILDGDGEAHFQADLTNEGDLHARLDKLAREPQWQTSVQRDRAAIAQLWEEVFDHNTFLGRSGTMFAFEGLGSIYWHMVAKLLLAVQETHDAARGPAAETLGKLYREVRAGLGFTKTPAVYGAFPSDPYSHSPSHLGAQQPGMTGQVKEEILTRWGELGVEISGGTIRFQPRLLGREEFSTEPFVFTYLDQYHVEKTWELPASSLAFTYCQIPVSYRQAESASIVVERAEGETRIEGNQLPASVSAEIFSRQGTIRRITVEILL